MGQYREVYSAVSVIIINYFVYKSMYTTPDIKRRRSE